jgi:hypothetical protein
MEERNNQFKLGPHLHFVNYLWPEYSKTQVWKAFDMREHDIKGAHIRLQPFPEYESEGNYEFRELATELITKYKKSKHSNRLPVLYRKYFHPNDRLVEGNKVTEGLAINNLTDCAQNFFKKELNCAVLWVA